MIYGYGSADIPDKPLAKKIVYAGPGYTKKKPKKPSKATLARGLIRKPKGPDRVDA